MSSILDDPMVRRVVFPISVEFYHQAGELGLLGEDVQLLEGTLVKKMSKSPLHESLVEWLQDALRGVCLPGWRVLKERPLTLAQSEPEPDLSVVRGSAQDFRSHHPTTAELVIEVAVSTLDVDRRKAPIYAAAGVTEYWIVIPEERRVEIHREPQADGYRQRESVTAPAQITSVAVPGFSLSLEELFHP